MTIAIQLNNSTLAGFTEASVERSMTSIAGGFSIMTPARPDEPYPVKTGDDISILVDGEIFLTGFVEVVNVSYSGTSHNITFSGRDLTGDIIDSTLGDIKELQTPITFEEVVRQVTGLEVINEVGAIKEFKEGELVSGDIGQTIFNFINSYAKKAQVLLTTNGLGQIVITRTGTTLNPNNLKNVKNNKTNNIIAASGSVSTRERFNKYTARSQLNPAAAVFDESPETVVSPLALATDSDIRTIRKLEFNAEESLNSEQLQDRVDWESNIRRARSDTANITVPMHSANGKVWIPNELVYVKDEFLSIDSEMLIESVRFKFSNTTGSTTTLKVAPPDAYSLDPTLSLTTKSSILDVFS